MANAQYAETAVAYEVSLATTNTEYSFQFPAGTKRFRMQCRDGTDVRIAFVTGKVATPTSPYHVLKSGHVMDESSLWFGGVTMYLAATGGSKVVEILCFT